MPPLHPHAVPSDIWLEHKGEVKEKEEASAVAFTVGEQVSELQVTLNGLSQVVRKLHGVIRGQETEAILLRRENSELKQQLARGFGGNAAFAGTGEMPPTPRETEAVKMLYPDEPPHSRQADSACNSDGFFQECPAQLWVDSGANNRVQLPDRHRLSVTPPVPRSGTPNPPLPPFVGQDIDQAEKLSSNSAIVPSPRVARKSTVTKMIDQMHRKTLIGHRHGQRHGRGLFADANAIKEEVRKAIARPVYDVMDFYHEAGCFQKIARHPIFEYVTLAIIFINAIWIAVDTELNIDSGVSSSDAVFVAADNFFCSYFLLELLVRFFAFEQKRNVFKDGWFAFDFALVVLMTVETWILPLVFSIWAQDNGPNLGDSTLLKTIRLVRVTRMARMAKLLRCVPELIIVIKGIGVALRSVMYTWILMVAIIYVFAIAFRQLTYGTNLGNTYFKGVFDAMYTLLLRGTLPDLAEFMEEVGQESVGLAIILMFFILLVSLTVMNMLIGVLVDVVGVVSKVENYELQVAFVKQKLLSMLETSGLDEDGNHQISRREFGLILVKPEAAKILQDLGVDPVGLVDFTEFIFKDEEELDFPRFMEVILQLRGTNAATVRDVVDMRKWVAEEFKHLERSLGVQVRSRASFHQKNPPSDGGGRGGATSPSRPAWQAGQPSRKSPTLGLPSGRSCSVLTADDNYWDNIDHVRPMTLQTLQDRSGSATPQERLVNLKQKAGANQHGKAGLEDDMFDEEV